MRPDLKVPTPEVLSRFAAIVGDKGALTAREDTEPYLNEWRGLYHGRTPLVLRPQTVSEVSAILKLAHEERTALVPQGGNTGLVGGQIPFEFWRRSCVEPQPHEGDPRRRSCRKHLDG